MMLVKAVPWNRWANRRGEEVMLRIHTAWRSPVLHIFLGMYDDYEKRSLYNNA